MNINRFLLFFTIISFSCLTAVSQIIVAEGISNNVLVNNVLVGDGVATRNIKYKGDSRSIGLFENGDKAGLTAESGIILSSGIAVGVKGPNNSIEYTSGKGGQGDDSLSRIAGFKTLDAAILQFDFKPQAEDIEFRYVFGSEEYPEWVGSAFNDVFGFFISGPGIVGEQNVALIPNTTEEVSINNVNGGKNSAYYVSNSDPSQDRHKYLQMDGYTVVLKAKMTLVPCEWYTIRLAIADVADDLKDSWVFIESKSFKHRTLIGKDTLYCSSEVAQVLDAGHPTREVLWSTGAKTQQIEVNKFGTYWVQVFTDCGSFKDEIKILPAVEPFSLGPDTFGCGNTIDINLDLAGRQFDDYLWSDGSTEKSLRATEPGTYWLRGEVNGCFASDTILIEGRDYPFFDLGLDTTLCGDINFTLNPNVEADTYQWHDGSEESSVTVTTSGLKHLFVQKDGCFFRDSIVIRNRTPFAFDIGPPRLSFCDSSNVELSTGITNDSLFSTLWSTGDTVYRIGAKSSGRYSVVVKDRFCDFEYSDEISLEFLGSASDYYVPNAFSPSSDFINETFKPFVPFTDIKSYKLIIYDKWGSQVFYSENPDEEWDGNVNGKPSPQGVYIWHCSVKTPCLPDQLHHQKGTLTLLR